MYPTAVTNFSAISLNERVKFLKLLIRWKGSLWKLLWADFVWFICAYTGIALLYRLYLIHDPVNKDIFDSIINYMNKVATLVPLSFLLGFFVSTVLGRWWTIAMSLPWMTKTSFTCQALITSGNQNICKDIRFTIVRYMNLACILSLMKLSKTVKQRFLHQESKEEKSKFLKKPNSIYLSAREKMKRINSDAVVKKTFGKLIIEEEIAVFERLEKQLKKPTFIVPLMWATKLLERSFNAGHIKSNRIYLHLFKMIQDFRGDLGTLSVYNGFNVPLVYTQVIVIVVYIFLISELFTEQLIDIPVVCNTTSIDKTDDKCIKNTLNNYLPIFGILKFLIYMGWFKVGLSLINPFGGESNDFPLNDIINFNLEVCASIVPAEDSYFPDYLSEKINDAACDRFEIFEKFRTFIPKPELNINIDEIICSQFEKYHKYSPPDRSSEFELQNSKIFNN